MEDDGFVDPPATPDDSSTALDSTDRLERSTLGSLMLVGAVALPKLTRSLKAADFTREAHRLIFDAIVAVSRETDPDLTLVIADLDSSGQLERAGGAAYVAGLLDDLPAVDNVIFYAKRIRERSILRKASKRRPA